MTPESLASSGTEAAHQTALFCWAALNVQRFHELEWLHHIPNGGSRGAGKDGAIAGGRMKAQGVKRGVADIFLPVRRGEWSGLYIEMKKPSLRPKREGGKGGVTDEQVTFGTFVRMQGFGWCVCYDWKEAADRLTAYLEVSA